MLPLQSRDPMKALDFVDVESATKAAAAGTADGGPQVRRVQPISDDHQKTGRDHPAPARVLASCVSQPADHHLRLPIPNHQTTLYISHYTLAVSLIGSRTANTFFLSAGPYRHYGSFYIRGWHCREEREVRSLVDTVPCAPDCAWLVECLVDRCSW